MLKGLILISAVFTFNAFAGQLLKPDPNLTSGDVCTPKDADFSGYRYKEHIAYCVRNVSYERKAHIYETYGIPENCRREYTIDHFIPLSIGGSNQERNLWPEHRNVKATRQMLEQEVFEKVEAGEMKQADALQIIAQAKMNPATPKPWTCGTALDGVDLHTENNQQ